MTIIPTHKDLMKNKKAVIAEFVIMEREEVKLLREERQKLKKEYEEEIEQIEEARRRASLSKIELRKENNKLKEEIERLNSQFNNISNMVDDKIKNM